MKKVFVFSTPCIVSQIQHYPQADKYALSNILVLHGLGKTPGITKDMHSIKIEHCSKSNEQSLQASYFKISKNFAIKFQTD